MSGKKEWEVAAVLNQSEDIQKEIFSSYNSVINSDIETIEKIISDIEKNRKEILSFKLNNFDDVKKELKGEAENIENGLKNIKNSVSSVSFGDVSRFKKRVQEIQNRIDSLNKESKKLRTKIANSPHYLNSEYAEAEKIKQNMQQAKSDFQNLKHAINNEKNSLNKILLDVNSKLEDLDDISNQVKKLDLQAKRIKEIRNKANELKKSIKDNFNDLDKNRAMKFTKDAYLKISNMVSEFNSLDDKAVIERYSQLSSKINNLKTDYNQKYNSWLAEKRYTEEFLKSVKEKGSKKELILIEDLAEDIDEKISKFEYYDTYKKTNTLSKFNSLITKSRKLLESENFSGANEILNEANSLYEDISNKADDLREKIEASANLSFKIRDLMLSDDINFSKAHLEIIDGNPLNGFRLECQNGDTINFEEIKFSEDGSVIVKLDHIENTNGTCGIRWADMKKVFNKEGIPLMDVKKNGNSVIYRDVRKDKKINNEMKRGR